MMLASLGMEDYDEKCRNFWRAMKNGLAEKCSDGLPRLGIAWRNVENITDPKAQRVINRVAQAGEMYSPIIGASRDHQMIL